MRAREGDLIRNTDEIIFDVKGLVHPPEKVIAFPRFIPSPEGTRGRKDLYRKMYNLAERFRFLEKNVPDLIVRDPVFDETLCEVPICTVKQHYRPVEKLRKLRSAKTLGELERKALQFAEEMQEAANIPWSSIGISGSLMVDLATAKSDIDPLVYGVENCKKANSALKDLVVGSGSHFASYSREDLKTLFEFRSKDTKMTFVDFAAVESRKACQGKFMGTDYFVRFVKAWSEVNERYGDVCYENLGYTKIEATVSDDSESLFTPCNYGVENVRVVEGAKISPIQEIASFRGRFCMQVQRGERVMVQGKVERVTDNRVGQEHFRILLGNKPSDYMALSRC